MLGSYDGYALIPGMGVDQFVAEHDLAGLFYGSPHTAELLQSAVIAGDARDAGNTGNTEVIRPGVIMARRSTDLKWVPYVNGGANETNIARGVMLTMGLNTQLNGADADRFLASIIVIGNLNPEACFIAANTAAGIGSTAGNGLEVRRALAYNIRFSDDPGCLIGIPFGNRP